jgi:uncharacterized protein (DUF924 family)
MMRDEVLTFWFEETQPVQWFRADPAFDATIARRFGGVHAAARVGELWPWRTTAAGRLAEVIVLDQFARNLFPGRPEAFADDALALVLAQEAVGGGHDASLPAAQRRFLYMPYMHSESLRVHDEALRLFTALGDEESLDYERRHRAIIERFGRYPHRNAVLGRSSTAAERAFLEQPGSGF